MELIYVVDKKAILRYTWGIALEFLQCIKFGLYALCITMNIYLLASIFTIALSMGQITARPEKLPEDTIIFRGDTAFHALTAPKTPFVELKDYAETVAHDIGINPLKFRGLIACESQWDEDAQGDGGRSFGILQFQQQTFDEFTKKYDHEEFAIDNPLNQIDLAALMIRDGYIFHWKNCARKIRWE